MEQVIVRRAANALFADAEPPDFFRTNWIGRVVAWPIAWLKQQMGGLWVGGTVTITTEHVRFEPNAVNVAVHANARSFLIPHGDIRDVRVEKGWCTDIVVLATDAGEQRFRCFKADAAAQAIANMRRTASA